MNKEVPFKAGCPEKFRKLPDEWPNAVVIFILHGATHKPSSHDPTSSLWWHGPHIVPPPPASSVVGSGFTEDDNGFRRWVRHLTTTPQAAPSEVGAADAAALPYASSSLSSSASPPSLSIWPAAFRLAMAAFLRTNMSTSTTDETRTAGTSTNGSARTATRTTSPDDAYGSLRSERDIGEGARGVLLPWQHSQLHSQNLAMNVPSTHRDFASASRPYGDVHPYGEQGEEAHAAAGRAADGASAGSGAAGAKRRDANIDKSSDAKGTGAGHHLMRQLFGVIKGKGEGLGGKGSSEEIKKDRKGETVRGELGAVPDDTGGVLAAEMDRDRPKARVIF